jgi:hypothetical protein
LKERSRGHLPLPGANFALEPSNKIQFTVNIGSNNFKAAFSTKKEKKKKKLSCL